MAITSPAQTHAEFEAAFNAGNGEALVGMYEPEAALVPEPGAQPVRGAAAIREALAGFLAMKGKIKVETVFVHEIGGLAFLRARWSLTATGPDGNPIEMSASSFEVIRRQPDGTWLYVFDHPFGAS